MHQIYFEGTMAHAVSPEGKKASMPIGALLSNLEGSQRERQAVILPPGVRTSFSRGHVTAWVHETAPETFNFKWIANHSVLKFGPGATYRDVRVSLPFVIILAFFVQLPTGQVMLSGCNECFFRVKPLQNYQTDLLYFPALLNCSRYRSPEKNPLSWICTQYLKHSYEAQSDLNTRMQSAFQLLHHLFFETAFNLSSEFHPLEGSSWFTESCGVDKRIATIEAWQEATAENEMFVMDVPWLPTGLTVSQVIERTFANLNARTADSITADALARIIFNQ